MRNFLLSALLLGTAFCLSAQTTNAQASGWARVQALSPNTTLHIKARTHNAHCRLQAVDAHTLTCALGGNKTETYQRADIASIKVPHRTRSTVVGLAAGAGVGAAIGAAAGRNGQIVGRAGLAGIFAVPLGLIGALIGAATDFTSATIYHN